MVRTDQHGPHGSTKQETRYGWPSSPAEVFKIEREEHLVMTEVISRTTELGALTFSYCYPRCLSAQAKQSDAWSADIWLGPRVCAIRLVRMLHEKKGYSMIYPLDTLRRSALCENRRVTRKICTACSVQCECIKTKNAMVEFRSV